MNEVSGAPRPGSARWIGPLLTLATLVLAALLHRWVGPPFRGDDAAWYAPTGTLREWLPASPLRALAMVAVPALVLAAAACAATRSALLRCAALTGALAALTFSAYGLLAPRVWVFFGWRFSLCMLLFAAIIGLALAAPLLARRWQRLPPLVRWPVYLAVAFPLVAIERNVTGTDPALPFGISPWPAVQIFGLEIGASLIAALLLGAGFGLRRLGSPHGHHRLAGVAVAVGLPLGALWAGSAAGLLPFQAGPVSSVGVGLAALGALALFGGGVARDPARLRSRGRVVTLGGLLLAGPLVFGQLLTRLDYAITRDLRAERIIQALGRYHDREQAYPDELGGLVEAGDLPRVPRPQIGFAPFSDQGFVYQNFGDDYLIEFAAPRWIQCAYNPPWHDEDDGEARAANPDEQEMAGSWTCPARPPDLW